MIWLSLAAAYLLGALPFSFWLVRRQQPGVDLRLVGSGNPGATNALRVGGVRVGLLTLVLDILKGYLAIALAQYLGVEPHLLGTVAVAAVVGHVAPVWLRFRGGKGVATAAGALMTIAPQALAVAAAVFVFALLWTRTVALGSVGACLALPVAQWGLVGAGEGEAWVILSITLIALLVVARHRVNLRQVWIGREAPTSGSLEDL